MKTHDSAIQTRERLWLLIYITILFSITWLIYAPGFSGIFLFDDFSSLSQLGDYGTIDNPESFWLYLLSNSSGPTGRPISMLSFLLDARSWPADPEPFKRTNVVIHLLNGLVLFALARKLAHALNQSHNTASYIALLTTALWLLHPFFVSTTLYAVQRMAQLSTLFVLLGLLFYVGSRLKYPPALSVGMAMGTSSAVGIMGLLAILSKENGALLPLLIIALELTVLRVYDQTREYVASNGFKYWRLLILGLPTLLLVGYLSIHIPALLDNNQGIRSFTPAERLLTQGRILWDYIFHLVIPRSYTGGLFNDDILISTSLFQPWHTFIAWATWLGIFIWALINRTKHPAAALAILFFLFGHLLESSFLQLELYFEHRNYLPATLLGFPLALWWINKPVKTWIKNIVVFGLLAVLALHTGNRASLWGNPFSQAISWAQINPESPRAQIYLAEYMRKVNKYKEAETLNARAIILSPTNIAALGQKVSLDCQFGKNADGSVDSFVHALIDKKVIGAVDRFHLAKTIDFLIGKTCGDVSKPDNILNIIRSIQDSKHGKKDKALTVLLEQRAGTILLIQKKPQQALISFRNSTNLTPNPGIVLKNAALLATHKAYEQAIEYLDTTNLDKSVSNSWNMSLLRKFYTSNSSYYQREKIHLRKQIAKDAFNESGGKAE